MGPATTQVLELFGGFPRGKEVKELKRNLRSILHEIRTWVVHEKSWLVKT